MPYTGNLYYLSRQELYVSKRFAMKESQNRLLQDLIKEAKLSKVEADALLKEHLENIAAVDKVLDDQKARQVKIGRAHV